MVIGWALQHAHVGFARLARQPLESLPSIPALIPQCLQRGLQVLSFLAHGVLEQLAGEADSTLLQGEDVVGKGFVGALDLFEDLFELLLGSLVVHQLLSLPSLTEARW